MALDSQLLNILACPKDKGPLLYFEEDALLYNPRERLAYEIREGIPVMLIEEARTLSDQEHSALVEKAASLGIQPNFEQ